MATAAPSLSSSSSTEIHIFDWLKARDPEDDSARKNMIKHIKDYKGEPVAPNKEFAANWAAVENELKGIMDAGLVPADSILSMGLDNESYRQFQTCADTLQSLLYEGELFNALGNLRGFRRLFSESRDSVLRHALRGEPLEVLKNIYFGGTGILPEDRMKLADPFSYENIGKGEDDVADDWH